MDPIAATQKGSVDVEKIGVLLVPHESRLNLDARRDVRKEAELGCGWLHGLRGRSTVAIALANDAIYRTLAAWRTLEPGADFGQAQS